MRPLRYPYSMAPQRSPIPRVCQCAYRGLEEQVGITSRSLRTLDSIKHPDMEEYQQHCFLIESTTYLYYVIDALVD
jgi:hypothetical protein